MTDPTAAPGCFNRLKLADLEEEAAAASAETRRLAARARDLRRELLGLDAEERKWTGDRTSPGPGFKQRRAELEEELSALHVRTEVATRRQRDAVGLVTRCHEFLEERGVDPESAVPSTAYVGEVRGGSGGPGGVHSGRATTVRGL